MLVNMMEKVLIVLVALVIGGCASQPSRPNFLERSMQDCSSGDENACAMLGSLSTPPAAATGTPRTVRQRSQPEKDADAIMEGIRRARSQSPAQNLQISPAVRRDS